MKTSWTRTAALTGLFLLAAAGLSAQEPAAESTPPGVFDFLFSPHYILFMVLAVIGLVLTLQRWINKWVRIGAMAVVFILFGLDYLFPLHPSPMCGVTNLFMFKITTGIFFPVFVALFIAMFLPSLIGRKLFCGWVCPLGALQELTNKIPFKYKFKQFNFGIFNGIRMGLFVMFILTFFWVKDHVALLAERLGADTSEGVWTAFSSYSVYEPINAFELLHWNIGLTFFVMMGILLLASLVLYRPFCYSICPIGALTWLLEKVAPGRVRVDHDACTECMECVEASPCPTISKLIDPKATVVPDCTSCGECLRSCEFDAIRFGFTRFKAPAGAAQPGLKKVEVRD